ncbi:MAG: four helix bundle protein [Patescibacteria group bacterium]
MGDIRTFTDLDVWEKGHTLVISVYMATKEFPPEERYSLSDQMRRSAVSTTSNIAEGFGRQTYREKIQFYYIASGSLTELKNQLFVAKDVQYISIKRFNELMDIADDTHRLLNGLLRKTKSILTSNSNI